MKVLQLVITGILPDITLNHHTGCGGLCCFISATAGAITSGAFDTIAVYSFALKT